MKEARPEKENNKIPLEPLPENLICSQVGIDLTYRASLRDSKVFLGREAEVEQTLKILSRRGMRNIIFIGGPGVGKTFLVEHIAERIATNCVPDNLAGKRIIKAGFMDIWAYVGSNEDWGKYLSTLKKLIQECVDLELILFMDEIQMIFAYPHSMSFLKSHMADGRLTLIGTTTDEEYYTYLDRDRATMQRFQIIRLSEMNEGITHQIIKTLLPKFSKDFGPVSIKSEDIDFLIKLSNAYIPYQFQPAKAINLFYEIMQEKSFRNDTTTVTRNEIRAAVCKAVQLPVEAISEPLERVKSMEEVLNAHILGQKNAIAKICKRLLISKADVCVTPDRPKAVFLLAGPTGVGKTELAKALAAYLTGNEKNLIRLDMSTYADPGSIFALIGVPGKNSRYDEPQNVPLLSLQLKRNPYSVLLLDEIEKAHKTVRLLFLQAFDTGKMIDNLGNEIFLRSTVIIMTTNCGFSVRQPLVRPPGVSEEQQDYQYEQDTLRVIKEEFPLEFLGRVDDIIIFRPLTNDIMQGFVKQKIATLEKLTDKKINITEDAIKLLCEKGFHPEFGARDLNRAIDMLLGYKLALLKLSKQWDSILTLNIIKSSGHDELEVITQG